ncbi:MAG: PAS domain S-box protein, partial [Okeania sp. SIO2H7]|nr:PAS domain S-box protein [Okeania sp. SIO2H7]
MAGGGEKERSPTSDPETLGRFVQYLPAAVAMVDQEMTYLACSACWFQQWELDSEIIGKSHYQIFPNLSASWQQKARKCLAGESGEFSWSELTTVPDGEEKWVKWTIKPWLSDENAIGGLMLCSEPGDRPQPPDRLQLTQAAMDRAALGVLWTTGEGQICYANQRACESLGYSIEELLELNLDKIDTGGWGDRVNKIKEENSLTFESSYRTKDGSSFPVKVTVNYLEFNDSEYYCAFVRDISESKKVRLGLIDAREQLQAVLDAVPGLVSWVDSDLRYLGVNRHLANAYGLPAENFIGKEVGFLKTSLKFNEFVYEFFASSELKAAKEVTASVRGISTTYLIGAQKYHRSGSSQAAAVFVGLDISDRKEMEVALRRSEERSRHQASEFERTLQKLNSATTQLIQKHKVSSMGQLVASVAHEINNPINFISGNISHASNYTEDLLRLVELYQQYYPEPIEEIEEEMEGMGFEFLKQDLPNLLDSMTAGSERIREVVRSLRLFSRVDEAEMKPVDLHEGLDSALLILQNRLQAKGGRGGISAIKEYGKLP